MTTPAQPYDFGRYLQQQRRAKEIPLEAVSQGTKIRLVVLQHIENEDLKFLPTPTLTKGFIRAFADAVGADRDEALRRYLAALNVHTPKAAQASPSEKPRRVWLHLILAILLIIALIALSLYLVNLPKISQSTVPGEVPKAVESSSPATREEAGPRVPVLEVQSPAQDSAEDGAATMKPAPKTEEIKVEGDTPEQDTPIATHGVGSENMPLEPAALPAAPSDVLTESTDTTEMAPRPISDKQVLEVTAVELTWFQITVDNEEPREMMIQPEWHRTFQAEKRFQLVIGNAAGVQLKLNGQPVLTRSEQGKVLHLQLP